MRSHFAKPPFPLPSPSSRGKEEFMADTNHPPEDPTGLRFRAGVFCIILNYILGSPFLIGVETLAAYYKSGPLSVFGFVVYGFSWLLLGAGLWLAGPRAVTTVKDWLQAFFQRNDKDKDKEKERP